nr:AMP-binding protein [Oceanipulchritudo coccoides]
MEDPHWPGDWKDALSGIAAQYKAEHPPAILIPTSGTTGVPKYCIHTSDTLFCSARGFAERFGKQGIVHAVNVLPGHHVGGLMPIIRSMECSGRLHYADYRNSDGFQSAPFPLEEASISLVPTQLRRMLASQRGTRVLRRFGLILVGGAACPPDLLEISRREEIRLCPCYGSTETAAMVTALDPEEFLAGQTGVGTALPHAEISIDSTGRILVRSGSIAMGYIPTNELFSRDPFPTGDLGAMNETGHLHIGGRADRVIITGGENVHPEQIEAAAVATGLIQSALCRGVPDPDWGTRVELEVVMKPEASGSMGSLRAELQERLPHYAVPKAIHPVKSLPPGKGIDAQESGS